MRNMWIECNLPWVDYQDIPRPREPQKLVDMILKLQYMRSLINYEEFNYFQKIWQQYSKEHNNKFHEFIEAYKTDPVVIKMIAYNTYEACVNESPEYIAHQEALRKWRKAELGDSFVGRGLNQAGTLIELNDGHKYLIGHINEDNTEGDQGGFESKAIVLRYKVISYELD